MGSELGELINIEAMKRPTLSVLNYSCSKSFSVDPINCLNYWEHTGHEIFDVLT